jgi:branched-chain amino acid transport system ATP-binding protein
MMENLAILDLSAITMRFGALKAIDNISLSIYPGERHALLGTNGAGKTTLFNVISGDIRPSQGKILFNGRDLSKLNADKRCRLGIGRTYQTPLLFNGLTVTQNLIVAVRGANLGGLSVRSINPQASWYIKAQELCSYVGLGELSNSFVELLSHGQRKQLELGMALASDPSLLLLDEPAAGLSPSDRKDFIALIAALPRNLTLLFVEHDMEVALALAERVTVMKDGRILATGTPDEISSNAEVLRLYLGDPIEAYS